jgi:hypothetical protein
VLLTCTTMSRRGSYVSRGLLSTGAEASALADRAIML